jgi:hypothetical protein
MKRSAVFFCLGLVVTHATGCSDTENPAGPTLTAISSLSLPVVTVTGTVQNITLPRAMVGGRSIDAAPLRVFLAGTSISTEVNTSGQFTLESVPAGFVGLAFQGPGVDALLRLGTVQPGQRVDLVVTVNGSTASIVDLKNGRGNENQRNRGVEVSGTVARLRGTCPMVTFLVRTITITTNTVTNIDRGCSELRNDTAIDVTGTRQADGSILATRIEREDDDEDDQ